MRDLGARACVRDRVPNSSSFFSSSSSKSLRFSSKELLNPAGRPAASAPSSGASSAGRSFCTSSPFAGETAGFAAGPSSESESESDPKTFLMSASSPIAANGCGSARDYDLWWTGRIIHDQMSVGAGFSVSVGFSDTYYVLATPSTRAVASPRLSLSPYLHISTSPSLSRPLHCSSVAVLLANPSEALACVNVVVTVPSASTRTGYDLSGIGSAAFFSAPSTALTGLPPPGHHVITAPVVRSYSVPSRGTRMAGPIGPKKSSPVMIKKQNTTSV